MFSYGDSFGWAFRDPEWARKLLVQGLIALIPIVGQIACFGYALRCVDNLRSGRPVLPEPGFPLGRGVEVWLPLLVLSFIPGVVSAIIIGIGAGMVSAAQSAGGTGSGAGSALVTLGYLVAFLFGLAVAFMTTAMFAAAYEGGMGAAFNYPAVLRRSFANPVASLLGLVALFIAQLGGSLCYVGLFLTYGYGMSLLGGLVTIFNPQGAPALGGTPGYPQPGYGGPYGPPPSGYPGTPAYSQQPPAYGQPYQAPYPGSGQGQTPQAPHPGWGQGQTPQPPYPGSGQGQPPQPPSYPPSPPAAVPYRRPTTEAYPPGDQSMPHPPASTPPSAPGGEQQGGSAPWQQGQRGNDQPTSKLGGPESARPPEEPPSR